ncbi:MAG: chromosomal replication initiator protein DnaA [Candidatus Ornithospirochaeta sp.]|nr:chromosomal replication initiator protein DnaA [Candidatus Ornithospirochaeta sp.]
MENFRNIWEAACAQLQDTLPKTKKTWFERISFSDEKDGVIYLSCTSKYYLDNAVKNCHDDIVNTISAIYGAEIPIKFIIDSEKQPVSPSKVQKTAVIPQNMPPKNPTLNKNYLFDNFIVGDNNKFAFSAAQVIANNPGTSFNPCLIYGRVGLGKTHLLQAIGNYIDQSNPKMKIMYVTAESFTNEFIDSISTNTASRFKAKYRTVDVLLIDDIHFLQKKDSTQEELFHTFNDLYEHGKQIVFTCDRPITELSDITERLKTRFRKGLNVDLQPPAYETRVAIALQKCKEKNFEIDSDTLDYICQSIDTNIRDLEGALTTLCSFSNLVGKPITKDIAKEQLKNFVISPAIKNNDISIDAIIKETAQYFGLKDYDIKGKSRNKNIMLARHIAIYLANSLTSYSFSEIGKQLSGRDHTTIMHSVEKIKAMIETDDSINQSIDSIKDKLLG